MPRNWLYRNLCALLYVHKKIQPHDKVGKVQSGVEVDIIAITNDDKLVIIKVTKQHDKNNILEDMGTKIRVLNEYKIPGIIYMGTPSIRSRRQPQW